MSATKILRQPPGDRLSTKDYMAVEKERQAARAREEFYWFRRLIRPDMQKNWFTDCVENDLQKFYDDLTIGKGQKLAMMAPPQHGKSWAATDFMAWVSGRDPDRKQIFASSLVFSAVAGRERPVRYSRHDAINQTT